MSNDNAVAALAAELERLRRRVDEQQTELAQAYESAEHAHRVIVDIVDRVQAIADQQTHDQADPASGAPTSWLALDDPEQARIVLATLADWLTQIYVFYPGSADSLGECWCWHPAIIEELLALKAAWLAAYAGPTASAARAIDWHDRALPGVQRRLRAALADCSLAAHRRGGRADQLRPTVPATSGLDQIAAWWTDSHATTGAPTPDPDTNNS